MNGLGGRGGDLRDGALGIRKVSVQQLESRNEYDTYAIPDDSSDSCVV